MKMNPTMDGSSVAEAYVKLALSIDRHAEGYVDAYFGPEKWRAEVNEGDPKPLTELADLADQTAEALAGLDELDGQRSGYLDMQLRAMQAMIGLLSGTEMSVHEEALALYDVDAQWIDEEVFHKAHGLLDKALPSGGSLRERMDQRRAQTRLSEEEIEPLFDVAIAEVRSRTKERYPLPPGEGIEFRPVRDESWSAYNWYLGEYRSRIELNIDRPVYLGSVLGFAAHEAYPGHHTELALKELRLLREQNRMEHCIVLLNTPSATVSEGIATRALTALAPYEDWLDWSSQVLYPMVGKTDLSPERLVHLRDGLENLRGVAGNAIFLIHDMGENDEEAIAYLVEYGLYSEEEARGLVRFIRTPQFRTYGFVYYYGGMLLDELFGTRNDGDVYFSRLLSDPVTPSLIRDWISAAA